MENFLGFPSSSCLGLLGCCTDHHQDCKACTVLLFHHPGVTGVFVGLVVGLAVVAVSVSVNLLVLADAPAVVRIVHVVIVVMLLV